jgi:hypothetical protein
MLEYPCIRRYSFMSDPLCRVAGMFSDNPTGADNQQETAAQALELDPQWVVGFVDGEGCFSVSIHQHPGVRSFGWQVNPVFQVSQHQDSRLVLDALVRFFGCGRVRSKGTASAVSIYAVDRRRDLRETVIPFFQDHPLVVKRQDFELFVEISSILERKLHFTSSGFERAVQLAYAMNAHGKQRKRPVETVLAGSSETLRQAPLFGAAKI